MPEPTHRLFFALRPDAAAAREIERAAAAIKASKRVAGRWLQTSKHHLTLHFLGSHSRRPADLIERARSAALEVRLPPVDIELERIDTFAARGESPCVLRCSSHSEDALERLRASLAGALVDAGAARWIEKRFTPHVTIAYVKVPLQSPVAIPAIRWRACDFALVESHGATARHELLDQWPLREPASS